MASFTKLVLNRRYRNSSIISRSRSFYIILITTEYDCHEFSKYLAFQKPWISIAILGISNQTFWYTRFFTPWNWNTGYFAWNTWVFRKLGISTNSRYREDYYVSWLFLFVPNVWTVLAQLLCYDDLNYFANIIHSSIYSVNNIFNCFRVILAAIIRILLIGMDI